MDAAGASSLRTLAFLLAVPVAYHCLWALGFQSHHGVRVLAHGVAGCFFFGALASKVLIVRSRHMPRWALPWVGGVLLVTIQATYPLQVGLRKGES
jgi:hypothetical protein